MSDRIFYGRRPTTPLLQRLAGPLLAIALGFGTALFILNCSAGRCFVWSLT